MDLEYCKGCAFCNGTDCTLNPNGNNKVSIPIDAIEYTICGGIPCGCPYRVEYGDIKKLVKE